jgi:hypothetical protein
MKIMNFNNMVWTIGTMKKERICLDEKMVCYEDVG